MEIVIGDHLYMFDNNTSIVLPLFLSHDGRYFPCEQWTDFADILNMWAHDLLKYKNRNGKFALYFEDGPYRLDIIKKEEKIEIQCVTFKNGDIIEKAFFCTYFDLIEAVYKASCKFEKILYAHGMHQGKYVHVYNQAIITGKELKRIMNHGHEGTALSSGS